MPDAIWITVEGVRTRVSTGDTLVTFSIPMERSAEAATFLTMVGRQVAAAFSTGETKEDYGEQANRLFKSGFFMAPSVWRAAGKDGDFLAWVRTQKCVICGDYPTEAAHVRRIANGSGTAIKPEYSAIPLCHAHHALQHEKGESAIGGKDKVDVWRLRCVSDWAWSAIKNTLCHSSMSNVSPNELRTWAKQHGVDALIPADYQ